MAIVRNPRRTPNATVPTPPRQQPSPGQPLHRKPPKKPPYATVPTPARPRGPRPPVRRQQARSAYGVAHAGLTNALRDSGLGSAEADTFARIILTRPGIVIGKGGQIIQNGKRYNASSFATSALADFVTGRQAERQNRAAIEGESGYQAELAQLGLERDLATSDLEERRRRAILDFGDSSFAGDPLLGAQAAANRFSTSRLLANQARTEQAGLRNASNQLGTLFGGGFKAGTQGLARANAGRQTEATRSLSDLLSGVAGQTADLGRSYDLGNTRALSEATQRLISSGTIRAAAPPQLGVGKPSYWWTLKKPKVA